MNMDIDSPKEATERPIKDKDLFKAAETGDPSTFKSLSPQQLSKSLSLRSDDDRSLLHVAASSSHPEVVKMLLDVDDAVNIVNAADEEGWAPIHSAASISNPEITEILLNKEANVNLKNDGGRTALHYAASKGRLKIAELLISRGAKINLKNKVGCAPLHRGASTGNLRIV